LSKENRIKNKKLAELREKEAFLKRGVDKMREGGHPHTVLQRRLDSVQLEIAELVAHPRAVR